MPIFPPLTTADPKNYTRKGVQGTLKLAPKAANRSGGFLTGNLTIK